MRYLIRFLGICLLVLIPFFACMDFGGGEEVEGCGPYELPPLCLFPPCSEPDPCRGVVCPPDDNVCTREYCSGGSCRSEPVTNGSSCTYDGLSGVCVAGVCGENLCEDDPCDDGDACTVGTCDYVDGTCDYTPVVCDDHEECTEDTCEPADGCVFTAVEDGTECSGRFGMCEAGSCVAPCDLASDEEYPCPIIGLEDLFCCPGSEYCRGDCTVPECQTHDDCDDNNECTDDRCDYANGTCYFTPAVCNDGNPCTEDTCDPPDGCVFTAVEDGTECGGRFGMCEAVSCVAPCDLASDEEYPCPIIGLEDLFCCPGSEYCRGDCTVPECQTPEDCDDNNECTDDRCDYANGTCVNNPVADNTQCDFHGLPGLCISGRCEDAELCEGVTCDDTECKIDGVCDASDGMCDYTLVDDGTACAEGECLDGVCAPVGAFHCTEQGILDAIAEGGGPHFFACDGPTTVSTATEIVIDNNVILDGEGNLTVDAHHAHRVFSVASGVTADLRGMTVTGGRATEVLGEGGGIYNAGDLTLTNSTVSGNTAYDGGGIHNDSQSMLTVTNSTMSGNSASRGGGIFSWGTVTVINSTVSGNAAYSNGGGVYNGGGGTLTNSTVSGNTAVYNGGGIESTGALTVTNSTVWGNSASGGGGIRNAGTLTVTNSTVSGNSASRGGGIHNTRWGELTLTNSTVSGNSAEWDGGGVFNDFGGQLTLARSLVDGDCEGDITSNGYNIESPANTCGFDQQGDQPNVPDPMLGPLQFNGGLTETHALLPGSTAINRIPGDACEVDTDQRGVTRPQGPACDVGAFELEQ